MAASDGYTGALKGTAWVDFDRDGIWDANEPALPETPLVAVLLEETVRSPQSVDRRRAQETTITIRTDATGRFNVATLTPGKWRVTASLTTASLERVYDSGGALDWQVDAVVPINGVGEADFAAAGNATLTSPAVPPGVTEVNVTWEGVDKTFTTADDVVFKLAASQGRIQGQGLPTGRYQFGFNSASGAETVIAAELTASAHRLDLVARTVRVVDLPATGRDSDLLRLVAFMFATGVILLIIRRGMRILPVR